MDKLIVMKAKSMDFLSNLWHNFLDRLSFRDQPDGDKQIRLLRYVIFMVILLVAGTILEFTLSIIHIQPPTFSLFITLGALCGIVLAYFLEMDSRKSLQMSMEENSQILSAISSILIVLSTDNTVTHWNDTAEMVLGMTAPQTIGEPFFQLDMKWDWGPIKDGIEACRLNNNKIRLDDIRFSRTDGGIGELGITLTPILSGDHKVSGVLLFGSDITERKRMERQLLLAQKFKSIGELATGIAHEINTPTQYVGSNIRFLQDQVEVLLKFWKEFRKSVLATKAEIPELEAVSSLENSIQAIEEDNLMKEIPVALQESLEGLDHISQIVMAMKEFSHPGHGEKSLTDINHIIESTVLVSKNEWKYVAEMEMEFAPDLPLIPAYTNELKQAILNLLVNASDAVSDVYGDGKSGKGLIKIITKQNNDWVEIRVTDNGSGMPEEIQSFVFDPFFTTKDVGKGSGQGLSITYNIVVDRHKGMINFESEYGKGTTFIIRLPINPK